jgi:hypothetical protein
LLHSREKPSPGGSGNIKKSAVSRGENISKKKGEKSSNGNHQKTIFFVQWKAR